MAKVWFIADPHLGGKNVAFPGRWANTPAQNTEWILGFWSRFVSRKTSRDKQDIVFCLGDMAFDREHHEMIGRMPGRKILIRGNHDDNLSTRELLEVYEEIHGIVRYKEFWLSHAPIHPQEMIYERPSINIHGHVHHKTVPDKRYFNVCPENIGDPMIDLSGIRQRIATKNAEPALGWETRV